MPILHSAKIIFVHIPKTGGGTIEKTLGIWGNDNNGNTVQAYIDKQHGYARHDNTDEYRPSDPAAYKAGYDHPVWDGRH